MFEQTLSKVSVVRLKLKWSLSVISRLHLLFSSEISVKDSFTTFMVVWHVSRRHLTVPRTATSFIMVSVWILFTFFMVSVCLFMLEKCNEEQFRKKIET